MSVTPTPLGLARCGHCSAVVNDGALCHDDTCPVGLDLDRTCADDAAWFAARPDATARRRPPSWSERVGLVDALGVELPPGARWQGHVVVTQLAPGVRVRHFGEILVLLPGGAR